VDDGDDDEGHLDVPAKFGAVLVERGDPYLTVRRRADTGLRADATLTLN
jgi:hypothetical protein